MNYLLDNSGTVRVWETGVANLQRSLDEWRRMVGGDEDRQAYYFYCVSKKSCPFLYSEYAIKIKHDATFWTVCI